MLKKQITEFRSAKNFKRPDGSLNFFVKCWEDCEADDLDYLIGKQIQINFKPYKCVGIEKFAGMKYRKNMGLGIIVEDK